MGDVGRQHKTTPLLASACAGIAALAIFASTASAAPAGACSGKPGGPDRGAAAQYCPKEPTRADRDGSAAGLPADLGDPGQGRPQGQAREADSGADVQELPLLDYPSTSGLNALLIILLLAGIGFGALMGWRRFRASDGSS